MTWSLGPITKLTPQRVLCQGDPLCLCPHNPSLFKTHSKHNILWLFQTPLQGHLPQASVTIRTSTTVVTTDPELSGSCPTPQSKEKWCLELHFTFFWELLKQSLRKKQKPVFITWMDTSNDFPTEHFSKPQKSFLMSIKSGFWCGSRELTK